jgi:hypothetical protein
MKADLVFVEPELLDRVEKQMGSVMQETHCAAVMLIDRSGLVIAATGQMPMHPDQMGAMAASVYLAMGAMIRASQTDEFIVHLPASNARFLFRYVDQRLFLCAFCSDTASETLVRAGLEELAHGARNALSDNGTAKRRLQSVDFIEEKLNELFDR